MSTRIDIYFHQNVYKFNIDRTNELIFLLYHTKIDKICTKGIKCLFVNYDNECFEFIIFLEISIFIDIFT